MGIGGEWIKKVLILQHRLHITNWETTYGPGGNRRGPLIICVAWKKRFGEHLLILLSLSIKRTIREIQTHSQKD